MPLPSRAARPSPRRGKIALAIASHIESSIQWAGFAFWGFLTISALLLFLGVRLT
jgi:hypothetical protein